MKDVVVTGFGPAAPGGVGCQEFWRALLQGETGVRPIEHFDVSPYSCRVAGQVDLSRLSGWERFGLSNGRASSTGLVLGALELALADAGLSLEEVKAMESGVSLGSSTTDMGVVEEEYQGFLRERTTSAEAIKACFPHAPSSTVAAEINCSGPVLTFSTACSSGLHGVVQGAELIRTGQARVVVAGGVDTPITPLLLAGFCASGLLPDQPDLDPDEASLPFDRRRRGGILAEGAGVVVLEEAAGAARRGARAYARICGWGCSNAWEARNLRRAIGEAMQTALEATGTTPGDVDYICSLAPGDPIIDRAETSAIKDVFGSQAYNLAVSSIKSLTGNPLAAVGPLQVGTTALALWKEYLPPTGNLHQRDPRLDLDYVPLQGRTARLRRALINLNGFGGIGTSVVLERA